MGRGAQDRLSSAGSVRPSSKSSFAIHAEFDGAYGASRMAKEIKARSLPVSKERVRKLMRVAQSVLNRQFQTTAPDKVWTADITYIPTAEGWLYLAAVMDLYTRLIVGCAMDSRITKEMVPNVLRMARFKRKPKPD